MPGLRLLLLRRRHVPVRLLLLLHVLRVGELLLLLLRVPLLQLLLSCIVAPPRRGRGLLGLLLLLGMLLLLQLLLLLGKVQALLQVGLLQVSGQVVQVLLEVGHVLLRLPLPLPLRVQLRSVLLRLKVLLVLRLQLCRVLLRRRVLRRRVLLLLLGLLRVRLGRPRRQPRKVRGHRHLHRRRRRRLLLLQVLPWRQQLGLLCQRAQADVLLLQLGVRSLLRGVPRRILLGARRKRRALGRAQLVPGLVQVDRWVAVGRVGGGQGRAGCVRACRRSRSSAERGCTGGRLHHAATLRTSSTMLAMCAAVSAVSWMLYWLRARGMWQREGGGERREC